MAETASELSKIPGHVPEELVFQWEEGDFPEFETDPYAIYKALARDRRPIFFTPRDYRSNNGAWVVTSAAYCREVLQRPDPFTTTIRYANDNAHWPRRLVPLMMDPPEHTGHRQLIAAVFGPRSIDAREGYIRRMANELIDNFAARGQVEFMHEFSRVFPGVIFMGIMGLPVEMKEQFLYWEEKFFHDGTDEEKQQVGKEIAAYLKQLIAEKRRNPGDDLVSELIDAEVDGERISDETIEDYCFLMYIAGLDTVNGGLGHVFRWLAENPEEQQLLREEPERITVALEELLRIHTWIDMSRVLSRDYEFHGVQMKGRRPDCRQDPDRELGRGASRVPVRYRPRTQGQPAHGVRRGAAPVRGVVPGAPRTPGGHGRVAATHPAVPGDARRAGYVFHRRAVEPAATAALVGCIEGRLNGMFAGRAAECVEFVPPRRCLAAPGHRSVRSGEPICRCRIW